jgi:hypothetical protein
VTIGDEWPTAADTSSSEAPAFRLRETNEWRVAWYQIIAIPTALAASSQASSTYSLPALRHHLHRVDGRQPPLDAPGEEPGEQVQEVTLGLAREVGLCQLVDPVHDDGEGERVQGHGLELRLQVVGDPGPVVVGAPVRQPDLPLIEQQAHPFLDHHRERVPTSSYLPLNPCQLLLGLGRRVREGIARESRRSVTPRQSCDRWPGGARFADQRPGHDGRALF